MSGRNLNYHYGSEADTYSFYRVPKALFTDPKFANISSDAKLLYGLVLDRISLSAKNKWLDRENRVFIYFTLEDVCESIRCGISKAVKLMAELDSAKGIGLIERVKQGQGKPSKIYVNKCIAQKEARSSEKLEPAETADNAQQCLKSAVQNTEKQQSGLTISNSLDLRKAEGNKTEYSKTDMNYTEQSIYPAGNAENTADRIDGYRELIAENISYELSCASHGTERVEGILDLLTETVCSNRKSIRVGGDDMPAEIVRSRLLTLNSAHIDYVFECLDASTAKIQNIRAYLFTALYRAPTTMEPYYCAEARYDLRGGNKSETPSYFPQDVWNIRPRAPFRSFQLRQ